MCVCLMGVCLIWVHFSSLLPLVGWTHSPRYHEKSQLLLWVYPREREIGKARVRATNLLRGGCVLYWLALFWQLTGIQFSLCFSFADLCPTPYSPINPCRQWIVSLTLTFLWHSQVIYLFLSLPYFSHSSPSITLSNWKLLIFPPASVSSGLFKHWLIFCCDNRNPNWDSSDTLCHLFPLYGSLRSIAILWKYWKWDHLTSKCDSFSGTASPWMHLAVSMKPTRIRHMQPALPLKTYWFLSFTGSLMRSIVQALSRSVPV